MTLARDLVTGLCGVTGPASLLLRGLTMFTLGRF